MKQHLEAAYTYMSHVQSSYRKDSTQILGRSPRSPPRCLALEGQRNVQPLRNRLLVDSDGLMIFWSLHGSGAVHQEQQETFTYPN